jgi:hypothetical protein
MNSAELFAWTAESTPRLARFQFGAGTFAAVTVSDTATQASISQACCTTFNNKLYVAYNTAINRLHVWDGTSLRRVGINPPSAPTTATSTGSVTDTRKYRVRLTIKAGSTVLVRNEATTATAAVAMSSQQCTVTAPGSLEAQATHWELEASSILTNYTVWYRLGDAAVATTTIVDNNASLLSFTVSEETGTYTMPGSCKYVVADRDRLLFLNNWEYSSYASRVEWTPVLGTGVGDEERILRTSTVSSYVDVGPGVGGQITGGARFQGSIYVFKQFAIYKLVRTGDVEAPYQPVLVSDTIGCIEHRTICEGEDEFGNPALYFMGQLGPYRVSQRGVEFLGRDLTNYWARINWSASTGIVAHAVWYPTRRQVWYYITLDSNTSPSHKFVFHADYGRREGNAVRGGWTRHDCTGVTCSTMYTSRYIGAVEEGGIPALATYPLRPWIGTTAATLLAVTDQPGVDEDASGTNTSTTYVASILTQPYVLGGTDQVFGVTGVQMLSRAPASGEETRLTCTLNKDWGSDTASTATTTTTYSAGLTQVVSDLEVGKSGCTAVQVSVADGALTTSMTTVLTWNLDRIAVRFRPEERR